MILEIAAVFKIVDEDDGVVSNTKVSIEYIVDECGKKATKKELYESLKKRVMTLGDNYKVQDMTIKELEEFKKEEQE